ncbi:hypothetical protein [Jeongeupia chitinilytica]|uniref:Uncharacterized protein n=1 Tax=Jeongeupia chitinilytica TaxID=1041641 RepID=A0ABQ3GXA2_9NEIS|nr:hypothetical protein [Jeongeupia chitinilytica]GHD56923.1 hypothetical protein GCM10007350_04830 [Jeongeupia chitinilytica]
MKKIHFILPLLTLALLGFVVVNSMGCNYEVSINHRGLKYYGVCRGGTIDIIESDELTGTRWSVSAIQISVADQLIFLIRDRRKTHEGSSDIRPLDPYLQSQWKRSIVSYAWVPLDNSQVAFFQTAPHHDIWIGKREGPINLVDSLFPREPIVGGNN